MMALLKITLRKLQFALRGKLLLAPSHMYISPCFWYTAMKEPDSPGQNGWPVLALWNFTQGIPHFPVLGLKCTLIIILSGSLHLSLVLIWTEVLQIRLFWVMLVKRRNFDVGVETSPQSSSFSIIWKVFLSWSFSHRVITKEDIPRDRYGTGTEFLQKLLSSVFLTSFWYSG